MGQERSLKDELNQITQELKMRFAYEKFFVDSFILKGNQEKQKKGKSNTTDKNQLVQLLYAQVKKCRLCDISKTKKNTVFGEGNLNAEIMFVGEAPGHDEDLAGKPFVGAAGGLLTKIILAMGMKRENVYITNVLRCRPPGNRNPQPEEVACCRPYLIELVKIIQPKIICTLGKFAAQALLNETKPISRIRGNFFEFAGIPLMPTYHPAYLLRNPEDKKLVWQDMKKIIKFLS
ncbi:MAG: uracil-DNA glycosylase [Candidatus Omnitrophota bacterium]